MHVCVRFLISIIAPISFYLSLPHARCHALALQL